VQIDRLPYPGRLVDRHHDLHITQAFLARYLAWLLFQDTLGEVVHLGRKLVERLVADKTLGGQPVQSLILVDVVESPIPADAPKDTKPIVADFSEKGVAATLIQDRPDVIFHLAAIVSGDAEANFEKGYKINFNGSWALFEAIRQESEKSSYKPRFVFASTLAVFGPPFPDSIPDSFATTPTSSYGTQKAMTELLLADYSRKGYLDGVGVRLPTICIRPASPTRRPPVSSPASCANRWPARKRRCRWATKCATGSHPHAPPWDFSSPPPPSTHPAWGCAAP